MTRTTRWRNGLAVFVALLAVALVGCQPRGIAGPVGAALPAPPQCIGLQDLARHLGMRITHRTRTSAALRDGGNSVMIYADPAGETYVNGTVLPDSHGTRVDGDGLLVPAWLAERIRTSLGPAGEEPTEPVAPAPREPRSRRPVGRVVIDPGHGGKDPGATSVLGVHEKRIVLAISHDVAAVLRDAGVEVLMTRTDDRFIELEDRPAVANRARADLFVSIHADAIRKPSISGFTLYVRRSADADSLAAAMAISRHLRATGARSRGLRRADYRVLVHSTRPAVLVETGYLTNRWEAQRLATRSYQQRVARSLAAGILEYLDAN